MAVEVSQILIEGEIQQVERFDQTVSFSSILTEGTDALQFKGVSFETDETTSFKGITFETIKPTLSFKGISFETEEAPSGFAQIIMIQS